MVIFGVPAQLPAAIFGIAGAGLTVALKDLAGVFIDSRLRGLVSPYTKQTPARNSSQDAPILGGASAAAITGIKVPGHGLPQVSKK